MNANGLAMRRSRKLTLIYFRTTKLKFTDYFEPNTNCGYGV